METAQQLYRTVTGTSQKSQEAAAKPALQRTTTTDPLTGTLNHLNEKQIEKLEEFKERLQRENWWTPDGINGKPSHDEGTLLRYLRARKFDIDGAVGQFTDTEKWMKEERIEELYEHFDVDLYERVRVLYPQWTGHRDRRGIPIYVYEVKGLDSKNVSKYQKEAQAFKKSHPFYKNRDTPSQLLPLFALYHNLLNFVLPMCSTLERPNPEIPVTNSTNIVDIQGVGLTQFWNLKQHMQDASVLATAHYPETLDRIFIIGAPSFFPTVWGWVKRWFDPVTVSKIFILGKHEVKPTLTKFMELSDIPKKYGGTLDWAWGDLPHMGEAEQHAVSKDGHAGWVRGPCLWLQNERVVVGSENGKPRRSDKEIAEKKPIVYAADYTEEPVHQDRKASSVSSIGNKVNGTVVSPAAKRSSMSMAMRQSQDRSRPTTPSKLGPEPAKQQMSPGTVMSSPSGDSHVHLPDSQPGHPAVTAEYISPQVSTVSVPQKETCTAHKDHTASPLAAASTPPPTPKSQQTNVQHVPTSLSPSEVRAASTSGVVPAHALTYTPPPGQPIPGPLSPHQVEMTKAIAAKLEGESVSVLPSSAGANGEISHPDIIIASDKSKGLALEAEKLTLAARPGIERFETARPF